MSDMPCIYKMNMIEEHEQMEQDILSGRGLDVLFCLMDNAKTKLEIASRLGMPSYSVELYISRLEKAGLIKAGFLTIQNGEVEKSYQLASDEIEIINNLQRENLSDMEKKRKAEISAQHFALMIRNAIRNVSLFDEKPHKIKAYFMKAKEDDMKEFRREIDSLFEKYQKKEDKTAKETYSLFSVLAPYEMEE